MKNIHPPKFTPRQIEIMQAATVRIDKHGIQELTTKSLANDIGLSEAALYRHFSSKFEIIKGLLIYYVDFMNSKIKGIMENKNHEPLKIVSNIFESQFDIFSSHPALISVLFSEGIFQYNKEINDLIYTMMEQRRKSIKELLERGQKEGGVTTAVDADTLTTILMGGIRMVVLKWKWSGHKYDLKTDGKTTLKNIILLLQTK